ncbi:MAG: hypothetical protein BGO47_10280 [Microbacterium sp. 67-17]|uniref:hypothetical protein n=1 Tax=Microbacterium sp. 67-17 TaxID=1895782 RepID=UPI00095BD372|nr:hypothetical protein [Microbacterium sp. 67-17]OJV97243.1 MAG: hypothetical protein BGO47_10280 [Microbacterium sp. 67-17]
MTMLDADTRDSDALEAETLETTAARLDAAVAAISRLDPDSRAVAEEFALALDALSKEALTTIVRALREDPRGKELLFDLVDDPAVRMLLGMHGIIRMPDPAATAEATAPAPVASARPVAFVSLESLLRGPSAAPTGACGTGASACGPEGCGCGGH